MRQQRQLQAPPPQVPGMAGVRVGASAPGLSDRDVAVVACVLVLHLAVLQQLMTFPALPVSRWPVDEPLQVALFQGASSIAAPAMAPVRRAERKAALREPHSPLRVSSPPATGADSLVPAMAATTTSVVVAAIPSNDAHAADDAVVPVEVPRANPAHGDSPPVVYPLLSRRLGETGQVVLHLHVLADGRIGEAKVLRGSGFSRLDRAAVEGALRWQLTPASRGGVPVAMWHEWPVHFALN